MKTSHYIFYFVLIIRVNPQRIGEGQNVTDATQFPFYAMLFRPEGKWVHLCGGSLIHPEWILTAGHCLPNDTSLFDELIRPNQDVIFMGSIYPPDVDVPDQARKIVEIHRHPQYLHIAHPDNPKSILKLLNDIALLKVNKPFMLSTRVQLVRLSTTFLKCAYGIIIGIGDADYNSRNQSYVAKYAKLEIMEPTEGSDTAFDAASEFNTTYDYNSSGYGLPGDSGGPFICDGVSPPLQIGSFTGGRYDNETNLFINRFERVDYFTDFIKQHLPRDKYTQYLEKPQKEGTFKNRPKNSSRSSGTVLYLIFVLPFLLSMCTS